MPHLPHDELSFRQWLQQSNAYLHFSDGTFFEAFINRPDDDPSLNEGIWGEAAFTTAMSGYQESITDPSFLGQHLIFSTAHIGNYPSTLSAMQSKGCHAISIIARNLSYSPFLVETNRPILSGIDTRELIAFLTTHPDQHTAVIRATKEPVAPQEFTASKLICSDLSHVSISSPQWRIPGSNPIVVLDYGMKESIAQNLEQLGFPLVIVPHTTTAKDIALYGPRLVLLSNGPGDPRAYQQEVAVIKELLAMNIPLRGICLGHQLLALALGAKIMRLPYGQRGVNHPLFCRQNGHVQISSQNHGYAVEEQSFKAIESQNPLNGLVKE